MLQALYPACLSPVDHYHVDVFTGEQPGRRQATETSANDHYPVTGGAVRARSAHPMRSARCSPARMALAMAIRAGFTAPMLGKKLVSTT